jgi:5'-nucleotidase
MDMDGPLAAFDDRIYELAPQEGFGWKFICSTPCVEHRFATDCVSREDAKDMRQFINNSRWFRALEPVDGCIDGMNELAKHADVWICTKPLEANVHCRDDKAEWVRKYLGARWERRLIITPDKSLVFGAALVDDAIKPEWMPQAFWSPVVYRMPWNQEGSVWADLPHWEWSDGVDRLMELVEVGVDG